VTTGDAWLLLSSLLAIGLLGAVMWATRRK